MVVFPSFGPLVSAQPQGLLLRERGHIPFHPPCCSDPLIHSPHAHHMVAAVLCHEGVDGGRVQEILHERQPPVWHAQHKRKLALLLSQLITCSQDLMDLIMRAIASVIHVKTMCYNVAPRGPPLPKAEVDGVCASEDSWQRHDSPNEVSESDRSKEEERTYRSQRTGRRSGYSRRT